jgi:hypothetical protein
MWIVQLRDEVAELQQERDEALTRVAELEGELDRATKPRPHEPAIRIDELEEEPGADAKRERRRAGIGPRPMSEAPRVWVGNGKTGSVWLWCETPGTMGPASWREWNWVENGQVFMPPNQPKPTITPADLESLATCNKVDWLPEPGDETKEDGA